MEEFTGIIGTHAYQRSNLCRVQSKQLENESQLVNQAARQKAQRAKQGHSPKWALPTKALFATGQHYDLDTITKITQKITSKIKPASSPSHTCARLWQEWTSTSWHLGDQPHEAQTKYIKSWMRIDIN